MVNSEQYPEGISCPSISRFAFMEQERPVLCAQLHGFEGYENALGTVSVYILPNGLYFIAEFTGVPESSSLPFHIHTGLACENAGEKDVILPNIPSDSTGSASMRFFTDGARLGDISGRVVMLHETVGSDEPKIACGALTRVL